MHALVRAPGLYGAMAEEAGVPESELANVILEVLTDLNSQDRNGRDRISLIESMCPNTHGTLVKHARGAGFGRTLAEPAWCPSCMAGELAKTTQVPASLPRGVRRFQASGKAGSGMENAFFLDEAPGFWARGGWSVPGPIPVENPVDVPWSDETVSHSEAAGAPAANDLDNIDMTDRATVPWTITDPARPAGPSGSDVALPEGTYRFRVENTPARSRGWATLMVIAPIDYAGVKLRARLGCSLGQEAVLRWEPQAAALHYLDITG